MKPKHFFVFFAFMLIFSSVSISATMEGVTATGLSPWEESKVLEYLSSRNLEGKVELKITKTSDIDRLKYPLLTVRINMIFLKPLYTGVPTTFYGENKRWAWSWQVEREIFTFALKELFKKYDSAMAKEK